MMKDIIFTRMRYNGTKYDSIDILPAGALPVSKYARKYKVSSPAYVHVKYDRYKFGYYNKAGELLHTDHPGYDIVDFQGSCYVVNYQ